MTVSNQVIRKRSGRRLFRWAKDTLIEHIRANTQRRSSRTPCGSRGMEHHRSQVISALVLSLSTDDQDQTVVPSVLGGTTSNEWPIHGGVITPEPTYPFLPFYLTTFSKKLFLSSRTRWYSYLVPWVPDTVCQVGTSDTWSIQKMDWVIRACHTYVETLSASWFNFSEQ
jgi:hypothetical protein